MNHISHAKCGGQNQKTHIQKNNSVISKNLQDSLKDLISDNFAEWSNYDNISFYEEVASGLLQELAILGGLDTGCDMELIFPHIKNSRSILEVGAGYGRVLDYLIRQNYKGKIYAVERGLKFTKILRAKFKNKVKFFYKDLHIFSPNQKFDAILWLWSGISDFSPQEQLQILTKLFQILSPSGIIILDTLSPAFKTKYSIYNQKQFCIMQVKKTTMKAYSPTNEEILMNAKTIGFQNIKQKEYKTTTDRSRFLHFLRKKTI